MRTVVRSTLIAGMTGALMVSAAWAGIGISPLPVPSAPTADGAATSAAKVATSAAAEGTATTTTTSPAALGAGQLLVGAAKTPMTPRPDDMKTKGFPNARWRPTRPSARRWTRPCCPTCRTPRATPPTASPAPAGPGRRTPTASTWAASASGRPTRSRCSARSTSASGCAVVAHQRRAGQAVVHDGRRRRGLTSGTTEQVRRLRSKQIGGPRWPTGAPAAGREAKESFDWMRPTRTSAPDFIGGWGFVPMRGLDAARKATRTALETLRAHDAAARGPRRAGQPRHRPARGGDRGVRPPRRGLAQAQAAVADAEGAARVAERAAHGRTRGAAADPRRVVARRDARRARSRARRRDAHAPGRRDAA